MISIASVLDNDFVRCWSIFISLAVGASTGNEKGTQHSQEDPMRPPRAVDRQMYDIESYLRLGYAFGI